MTAVVAPAGFARVVVAVRLDGKATDASFTFAVKNVGPVEPYTDPVDIAAFIKDILTVGANAPYLPATTLAGNGINAVTVFLGTGNGQQSEGVSAGLVAGTLTNTDHNDMIHSAAVLVKKRTAAGGRKHAGRMFAPYLFGTEANVSPRGILLAGLVTNLQTQWNSVFTQLQGAGLPMYILHTPPLTDVPTEVTALVVSSKVGSQRRRLN